PQVPTAPALPQGPTPPASQAELRDVVTFGGDAHVRSGQQVRDVVTLGGDARIDGEAFGNVLTLGGDVDVQGVVAGDVVSMGGDIDVAPGGRVRGRIDAMGGDISVADAGGEHGSVQIAVSSEGARAASVERSRDDDDDERDGGAHHWLGETLDAAMRHALLFLLGLLFMGVAPARLRMLQGTIVKLPLRTLGAGFLGVIAGLLLTIVLVITILGIPAAIVLVLALFLGGYLGLATMASVIGAALPLPALANRPVLQLGVGVLILFVVSRVPVIGGLLIFGATIGGLGAVILTRLGQKPVPGTTIEP
nr:hypothetical protein [Myxococcota bacterium]